MKLRRYAKYVEKLLRIGRVKTLSCLREFAWFRTRLKLPRNDTFVVHSSEADRVRVRLVDPDQPFRREPPSLPKEEQLHDNFRETLEGVFPASFVCELENARFWGHYGSSVFTQDGCLVTDLSKDVWGPQLHSAYVKTHFPRPRHLPGRTLSLVTPEAAGNYHHWTVDLLPRAGLAMRAGYHLQDFDHILVKDRQLPYQLEAYAKLGLDPAKFLRVDDHTFVQADLLVVPSLHLNNTLVPPADMRFSRRLYLSEEPSPAQARRRLYVSRRDASFRRVANEHELLPMLQHLGFEEVAMSEMSVADQAKLFAEADVLIGPNGSALANLVFANPACRVIEFFAPGWVVPYNWMICANLGLRYTALIGEGPRPKKGSLPRELKADVYLKPEHLQQALDLLAV